MSAVLDGRPLLKSFQQKTKPWSTQKLKDDLLVLYSIWFNKVKGNDHASRLEAFYGPQAYAYDQFRADFLWGRRPLLAECACKLQQLDNIIWVDLGGGTAENVDLMSDYMPLEKFKAIYVVDLCKSLCEVASKKVQQKGWQNVHIVEGDACQFTPPEGVATLVTFSYSLSMIPPFMTAVDSALTYLDDKDGILGVADFGVSAKYDTPDKQMSWARRFFWRATFDLDGIDVGPERRMYLQHNANTLHEVFGEGSIPYVPYLRAPYYVWLGKKNRGSTK